MNDNLSGESCPRRPFGLVVIVYIFIAFAVADLAMHVVNGSAWWPLSLCASALLVYLFRKLWTGDERNRKTGAFLGFFVATVNALAWPDTPFPEWAPHEYLGVLEGLYGVCAALYLVRAARDPFFAARRLS